MLSLPATRSTMGLLYTFFRDIILTLTRILRVIYVGNKEIELLNRRLKKSRE